MNNILLLLDDDKSYFATEAKKYGIRVERTYKKVNILRILRRVHMYLHLPFYQSWLSDWKKHIDEYDVVIIHASIISIPAVKLICKNSNKIRVIFWYWNLVENSVSPDMIKNSNVEKWSFDQEECKRYNFSENTQYFFKTIKPNGKKREYDIFFVGKDKGRYSELKNLEQTFQDMGLRTYFHITSDKRFDIKPNSNFKKTISYTKVLDYINESGAILDYVSENQHGLTLRPLEALFLRKKLITTDKNIVDYDFYSKNNIFILGIDDISNLKEFIRTPIDKIDQSVIDRYDFSNWINRFL